MKVGVLGAGTHKDEGKIVPIIARFLKEHTHNPVTIVTAGSGNIATIARDYARHIGLDSVSFDSIHVLDKTIPYNPKYKIIRNKQIVESCDKLLVIWDGVSQDTEHAIKYARSQGVPIMVVTF